MSSVDLPKPSGDGPLVGNNLNDSALQRAVTAYPDEVKEPVLWLGAYLREECAGRYDVLGERVRKLGFKKTTDNFLYQIVRGSYFRPDGKGGRLGSTRNVLQIIGSLRRDADLARSRGKVPFVETTTWEDIRDYIDLKRAPDTVNKFGVVIGPTGSQKTACLKRYVELNNHGLCVHIEAPENGSMAQFLADLNARYGFGHVSSYGARRNIGNVVNEKRTVIVDNVQRLYKPAREHDQPIFHYLQKLQDDTGCTVVLSIAALEKRFLTEGLHKGFFEQFEGRAGGRKSFLELDDYTPEEDLVAIAKAFGFVKPDAPAAKHYLEKISREPGRVRILFGALQSARRKADAEERPLTLELLKEDRGEIEKEVR